MSEHYFGLQSGTISKRTVNKRDKIAREVGGERCGYTYANIPGDGWRGWGFIPNRGAPFDDARAKEIMAAWDAAGVGVPHRGA